MPTGRWIGRGAGARLGRMHGRVHHVVLDCPDPRALARFYSELLNQPITYDSDDNTVLYGPLVDQAALHGVLNKVRDLGVPLLAVSRVAVNGSQDDQGLTP